MNKCWDMNTESYDTSRLFEDQYHPNCEVACPRCDCGGYNFNDTWWTEYQDYDNLQSNQAQCMKCQCKLDEFSNITYADCDRNYDADYDIGTATCDPVSGIIYGPGTTAGSVPYYCHNQYSETNGMFILFHVYSYN